MRFLQHQASARRQTFGLCLLYAMLIIATAMPLAALVCFVYAWYQKSIVFVFPWWLFEYSTLAIAVLLVGIALANYLSTSGDGGMYAMQRLNGRSISASNDPLDARLINTVAEMVIAAGSGCPRPFLYVLDDETSINAITAGSMETNFAIGVTKGALLLLERAELQALIAHEMGCLIEEDTVFNQRLSSMTASLRGLQMLAEGISEANDIRTTLIAAVVWIVGCIGAAAGHVLQAAVARERAYLADARAVQFSRNPTGLLGVLRKIRQQNRDSEIDVSFSNHKALPMAHCFFDSIYAHKDDEGAWLDTHPSLKARMARLGQM